MRITPLKARGKPEALADLGSMEGMVSERLWV
jgi:hypothetical protein